MAILSETLLTVRYVETDQMGIVHHSNYVQYLELARIDWLSQLGISYKELESKGIILPVYTLDLKFKKSAYFDDQLIVKTCLENLPKATMKFDYKIFNQYQDLITIASTTLVFVNAVTKKPRSCPEDLLSIFTKHM